MNITCLNCINITCIIITIQQPVDVFLSRHSLISIFNHQQMFQFALISLPIKCGHCSWNCYFWMRIRLIRRELNDEDTWIDENIFNTVYRIGGIIIYCFRIFMDNIFCFILYNKWWSTHNQMSFEFSGLILIVKLKIVIMWVIFSGREYFEWEFLASWRLQLMKNGKELLLKSKLGKKKFYWLLWISSRNKQRKVIINNKSTIIVIIVVIITIVIMRWDLREKNVW